MPLRSLVTFEGGEDLAIDQARLLAERPKHAGIDSCSPRLGGRVRRAGARVFSPAAAPHPAAGRGIAVHAAAPTISLPPPALAAARWVIADRFLSTRVTRRLTSAR
jgi:hypothetical protein